MKSLRSSAAELAGDGGLLAVFAGRAPHVLAEQVLKVVAAGKSAVQRHLGDGVVADKELMGGVADPDIVQIFLEGVAGRYFEFM